MRKAMRIKNWMFMPLAVALAACTSTGVQQESKVATGTPQAKKIMVVAVSENAELKRMFEDQFVAKLKAEKVDAIPSYQVFGTNPITADTVKQAVGRTGVDSVLVARLIRTEQMPDIQSSDLYGLAPSSAAANVPTQPVYFTDARLFNANTAALSWGATLRTIDPGNNARAADDYSTRVVKAMKERKII